MHSELMETTLGARLLGRMALLICVLTFAGCQRPRVHAEPATAERRTMQLDENKGLVTRAIAEIFNERNYGAANEYVATDFHSHNPQVPPGPEGIETFARRFGEAFTDFRGDVQELVAEGDKVIIWIRWHGTHTGTFAGVPATGNQIQFDTVEIFRIRDGRLSEHWDIADRLELQRGLGLLK